MHYITGLIVVLCFAIFVVYIAIASLGARKSGKRQLEWRCWAFALVCVPFLLFRSFFDSHAGRVLWVPGATSEILADAAAALGVVIALWSRVSLGQSWSSEIVIQEKHQLVERGPYAYVRHPMYSGIILMLLGVLLWYGRMSWLLVFLFVFVGLYLKSRSEEELLERTFPRYAGYRKRTKALIPFVV